MPDEKTPRSEDHALAERLAAYDEALRAGHTPPMDSSPLPEADHRKLEEARDLLRLMDEVLPRFRDDPTEVQSDGSAPEPSKSGSEASPRSNRLGRFEIVRELGRGGFGIVFLAIDSTLGRPVALKVPRPEVLAAPEGRRRSLREAQAAAGLDHPYVVPVFEAGQIGPVCYIASPYYEGVTLAEWLARREEPVTAEMAARLTARVAEAVQHAHERGILHRDLKPANILLQRVENPPPNGPWFIPRVTDFGLARLVDQPADDTLSGLPIGSPPYMAPEQAEGRLAEVGPRTDIYALGAILYELLSGRPPHRGETPLETIRLVLGEEPVAIRRLRPDLPRDLEAILRKCLEKDPRQRYASAGELAGDLRRFLDGGTVRARSSNLWRRIRRWVSNPRRIEDAGQLTMILSGLLILWVLFGLVLVGLGVGLYPPRPGEYLVSSVVVILTDLAPSFWLGWKLRQRRTWALWAGTVFQCFRVGFQAVLLFKFPSCFGGLYEDPRLRLAVFALILLATLSTLLFHLVAVVAWLDSPRRSRRLIPIGEERNLMEEAVTEGPSGSGRATETEPD